MDALDNADALAINTDWDEFQNPDFDEVKSRLASPAIFDGRNLYDPEQMRSLGFTYHSIGRPAVVQNEAKLLREVEFASVGTGDDSRSQSTTTPPMAAIMPY
jgi:UDPglucose 6-dehydrogenase